MTSNYIHNRIKTALNSRLVNYYEWDDLHVFRNNEVTIVDFDVFSAFALRTVLSYLDKKRMRYTQRKCTRGGYLGGGEYREFTLISIVYE